MKKEISKKREQFNNSTFSLEKPVSTNSICYF